MTNQTMGQRIASERKKLGISQEQLGEKTGVSRQAISKWEADGAMPEIDKLIALSRLFGVSVGWLLGVEDQPEKQADELTDTQLKMVEEIVKRYQPEPQQESPKVKVFRYCLIFLIFLVGTLSIVEMVTGRSSTVDYSPRIASLEANFSSIESQLSGLSGRISSMSDSIEDAASPLSGYQFYLEPNNEADAVTVSIEAVPKTWDSDAATLYVRLNGAQYASVPFRWDGSAYIASVDVAYDDGYEYWMVLETAEGMQESVQLYNTNAQYPQQQFAITCEGTVKESRFSKASNSLNLYGLGIHLRQPDASAYNTWGNAYWTYSEGVVYQIRDGRKEVIHTESFLTDTDDDFHETWRNVDFGFALPELQDGDRLELWYRAGLNNGLSAENFVCGWVYQDGDLILSEAACTAVP